MVGGFYAPSHQVEYNRDIDGGVHPDSLQYYRAEFSNNGFECLANIILPVELVATILENTG